MQSTIFVLYYIRKWVRKLENENELLQNIVGNLKRSLKKLHGDIWTTEGGKLYYQKYLQKLMPTIRNVISSSRQLRFSKVISNLQLNPKDKFGV